MATTESQPKSDKNPTAGNTREIYGVEKSLELDANSIVAGESVSQARTSRALKRKESPLEVDGEAAMADSRRNPKRKATEAATAATAAVASREARDYKMLLREALAPIATDELQEWEGWCEVESEPVCFPDCQSGTPRLT